MRALIVDDDPVSLRLLSASLKKLHHEVVEAVDGEQALELYRGSEFRLVITDWMMPRMAGIELCEKIRAEASDRYSYIIIVTTLSAHERTLDGFRAGADDYLIKPLSLEQLETRIAVAERVCNGMDAKVEMTMRGVVEMCQGLNGSDRMLLESVTKLGEYYRTQRAYSKSRAFLRRRISILREHKADAAEIEKLVGELEMLQALGDDLPGG